MKTYQDLIAIGENEKERMNFALQVVREHKSSPLYKIAEDASLYYKHVNPTIMRAQKFVYDLAGRAHVDIWAANHKIPSRYYYYFITQAVQYLLGNGVSFKEKNVKEKLGDNFDYVIQKLATDALNGGVSFGFWNFDHVEPFSVLEFAPLMDEENGSIRSGVRFWQIDDSKPLRMALFEEDGYTEYIRRNSEDIELYKEKQPYITVKESSATGTEIYDGGNYEGFPIVPLYNVNKQSELVGSRETIDAYDLMASQLVNNIDDANIIYWVIKNAGGMDDIDDERFIQRLKTLHVTHLEGNEEVDSHSVDVPFEASETALKRLRSQLFDDFMALDVKEISGGATTATQIKAAYEPLNQKTDLFEAQVTQFITEIMRVAGLEGNPTYTRSVIVNQEEVIQVLAQSAQFLSEEYVTRKILETLGDIDNVDEVLRQMLEDESERYQQQGQEQ